MLFLCTDAQCAPLRSLHKFLYVGAAIGRPFGMKVTFVSDVGELHPSRLMPCHPPLHAGFPEASVNEALGVREVEGSVRYTLASIQLEKPLDFAILYGYTRRII